MNGTGLGSEKQMGAHSQRKILPPKKLLFSKRKIKEAPHAPECDKYTRAWEKYQMNIFNTKYQFF